jgi:ribosomal-protein-alanine N-acetyltransferase
MSTTLNMVELRPGTTADLPIVDQIMREAFDPRFGEAWTRGQCLGIMAIPGVWLTIASIEGRPAGFSLSRIVADEAELLLLATLPGFRRRGAGRALVGGVAATARSHGATRLHLEVRSGNEAIKLYSVTGFVKVGERRGYYRGPNGQLFDALTFSQSLS